jgi:putative ABC transport system permease protein
MSLWKVAWRSIEQRGLSSLLTALSMALGVALVVAVLVIYGVVKTSFTQAAYGYDMIVGAKGGKLQLVLNTVYHLSTPIENIPWSYYKEFVDGKYASQVGVAIPYCLGDNYQGFRVVGTLPSMFDSHEYVFGKSYSFRDGRNFKPDAFFEAVIGDQVARRTGLKVGDRFKPTHGVTTEAGTGHDHDEFTVVGILDPTGTPNDRAVFVNLEGFYLLDGHAKPVPASEASPGTPATYATTTDKTTTDTTPSDTAPTNPANAGHENEADHADHHDHAADHPTPLPDNQREVTAILVRANNPVAPLYLTRAINKEPFAQAVSPVSEIEKLFAEIVGNIQIVLLVLAFLVVVVAGLGIMVSIYNSMANRRREIAVMRALGASRRTVMVIVLLESILLSVGGGLLGVLLGHGAIALMNPWIVAQTGVSIGLRFEPIELVLIPILIVLATLAGFVPAMTAYRTDVARSLTGSQ